MRLCRASRRRCCRVAIAIGFTQFTVLRRSQPPIVPAGGSGGHGGNVAGLGVDGPVFWVGDGGAVQGRIHVAFSAPNRAAVDAFYAAAIAAGGKDNGGPGLRPNYHPNYYAAYVFDPDGHNIEAVCHAPE